MDSYSLERLKKLQPIDEKMFKEMHRMYKEDKGGKGSKADKVDKGTAWIRLYPDDLSQILSIKGITSLKFIVVANLKKTTTNGKHFLPTLAVQLKIAREGTLTGFDYKYFVPNTDSDTCPLPDPCDEVEDSL